MRTNSSFHCPKQTARHDDSGAAAELHDDIHQHASDTRLPRADLVSEDDAMLLQMAREEPQALLLPNIQQRLTFAVDARRLRPAHQPTGDLRPIDFHVGPVMFQASATRRSNWRYCLSSSGPMSRGQKPTFANVRNRGMPSARHAAFCGSENDSKSRASR